MLKIFGKNFKNIYTKKCKQNNDECGQRCKNFISFLK